MPTPRDYYDTDFKQNFLPQPNLLQCFGRESQKVVDARLYLDYDLNAKFVTCFIPDNKVLLEACAYFLRDVKKFLKPREGLLSLVPDEQGGVEAVNDADMIFTNRVYLYHDGKLTQQEAQELMAFGKEQGIAARIRGWDYVEELSKREKPAAFICHDSRDKDDIARPLAKALTTWMGRVWFDEYSLKVGDSLRESIEKGLKECERCIVILSKNFIANEGWTKTEFNSIIARENVERKRLIFPVWHDVTAREVFTYSPILADRFAILWTLDKNKQHEVIKQLVDAMENTRKRNELMR